MLHGGTAGGVRIEKGVAGRIRTCQLFALLADLNGQRLLEAAQPLALRGEEFLHPLALLAQGASEFLAPGILSGSVAGETFSCGSWRCQG